MSREIDLMLYTDHDWGVYKYSDITKDVALELIKISEAHPNNVCLGWFADKERALRYGKLFNLDDVIFYLYYYELDAELFNEIDNNEVLMNAWNDSDCYTLDDERITKLKEDTYKTKELLQTLIKLNDDFVNIVYGKE